MIRCRDNTLYTGITTDLQRRFNEHRKKTEKCAKYTYFHDAISMECAWKCENRSLASKLEYMIKKLDKSKKETIIKDKVKLSSVFISIEDGDYIKVDMKDCNLC